MNLAIRRMALLLFLAFAVLAAGLSYVQVLAGPDYRDDDRNVRVALSRASRERGPIVTADGVVVASSRARLDAEALYQRRYPEAGAYAHITGYSSFLYGDTGLEEARAGALSSGRNSTISALLTVLTGGDLRAQGLRLTIDDRLQRLAIEGLDGQAGAVVALDPATGAVLALATLPTFDPGELVGASAREAGDALTADPGRPLESRATDQIFAPGSVFKIVTAAAALEAGLATLDTTYPDPVELALPGTDTTIRNFDRQACAGGGTVDLRTAFARSCNTVFGQVGLDVGADLLVARAEAFGFNAELPFDLAVAPSFVPPATALAPAAVAQTALGERDVRATALQAALLAAAVANDGVIMAPYLVAEVVDADGRVTERHTPAPWRQAVGAATAASLAELMEEVVSRGTGRRAAVTGVRVAGKTGTAEASTPTPHAWFVGFAPVDPAPGQRRIAVAVFVEAGGAAGADATGGVVAAPIAARLIEDWVSRP